MPVALRERIVAAYKRGGLKYVELAEVFGIGEATVSRLLARDRRNGDVAPDAHGGGNPRRIPPEQYDALRALVADAPDATRQELCDAWKAMHGVTVSVAAMGRTLRDADVTRKKNSSARRSKTARTLSPRGRRSSPG